MMTQKVSKSSIKVSLFKVRTLVLALVFLFAAQGVWGTDYYWVGGTDTDWTKTENWATSFGGTGGEGIINYPQSGAGDTIYFSNTDPDNSVKYTLNTPTDFAFGNLYVWGNIDLVINGNCTATSLKMEVDPDAPDNHFVANDSTVTLKKGSGTGKLTVTGDAGINLTRASKTDAKVGTFIVDTQLETKYIETHSGVTFQIDNTVVVNGTYTHRATNPDVIANTIVNGSFSATTFNMGEYAGSTKVTVGNSGLLNVTTFTSTATTYTNQDSTNVPFTNNGTITVTVFSLPNYNIVNNKTINTTGDTASITAGSFSGNNGVINLKDGTTSLTVTNASTQKTIEVSNSDCTITGPFNITNFSANDNMGAKTLTINGSQTITTAAISGNNTNKLSVKGSGSLALQNPLIAEYLTFSSSGPSVTTHNAYAKYSSGNPTGWAVVNGEQHVWNGSAGNTNWATSANWLPPTAVPGTGDDVIIDSDYTGSNNPQITTANVLVNSISITGANAGVEVGENRTLTLEAGCELDTKITGDGTLILASGKTFTITGTKDFDINIVNNGTIAATASIGFKRNFTDSGSWSGTIPTLSFDGTIDQSFTAKAGRTYPAIEISKASGTFTAETAFNASSFTVDSAKPCNINFNADNTITTFSATNQGGKTFDFGGTTQNINSFTANGSSSSSLLTLTGTGWTLTAGGTPSISNAQISNSTATSTISVTSCTDLGGNSNWNFLGKTYEWTGAANDNSWSTSGNWYPQSVPGKGTLVTIKSDATSFPVITSDISLTYNDTYKGSVTNNGTITFSGNTVTTGITAGQKVNGDNSLIIYAGTITSPVWGNTYKNIQINNGTEITFADATISGKLTNNGIINVTSSLASGSFEGSGTINLNGSTTTLTTNNASTTSYVIVLTGTDATIKGDFEFASFTATDASMSGKTITLDSTVTTIIKAGTISLEGTGTGSSLLTLAGTGTINPTSTFTPQYLSIGPNITLQDYSNDISDKHCKPSAGDESKYWLTVINNGWNIAAVTDFEYIWSGTNGTVWENGSNWNTGFVPVADCKITIPETTNKPVISAACEGGTLTIANGASVKLGTGNLALTGTDGTGSSTPILTNNGTIIYTAAGRITDGTNAINDTSQGTVEYADGAGGNITNFGDSDDYFNLTINGNQKWSLTGSTIIIKNDLTIATNAQCKVTESTTLKSKTFTFNGSFQVAANKNVTLSPYDDTVDFEIPQGMESKFNFTQPRGWVILGVNTYTGNIIFNYLVNTNVGFGYKMDFTSDVVINNNISVSNSITARKSISGDAYLIFSGAGNQIFTTTDSFSYNKIQESKTNGSLTINGTGTINEFKIQDQSGSPVTTVNDNCTITTLSIVKGTSTTFAGQPTITNFTAAANGGDITFNNLVTIQNDTTLLTNGAVSFKNVNFVDTGTSEKKSFSHNAGTTITNGTIDASNITLAALSLAGNTNLNVVADGFCTLNGDVTESEASTLTINGASNINTASITTTGTQTYNGAITLAPSGRQTTLTASGDGSQILLKADVGTTNSSSLTTAGVLIIGNNGGSGINVSVPLTVQNDVTFYSENTLTSLTATSMDGKTITFEAGKKQTFSGKLSLSGADANLLTLKSSADDTAWIIYCSGSNNHSINYVDVKDSDNSQTSYYLTASNSTDSGNNTNWAFPNMPYTWTGANNSTDWSDPQNWSPQSVPNAGAQILIPASTLEYPVPEYPVIDETISLTHTTNTGSITIENDASLGLTTNGQLTLGTITNGGTVEVSAGTLTVTTLVNNQTVNLTGGQIVIPNTTGATFTNNSTVNISGGTITGTRNNGNDSVVIYNGTGDTSPVWGNDYKNLQIANGCSVSFVNDITVGNDFTNNGSASIAASKKINVAGDVTSTGDITGDGTLNFNGTSDQTFTPNNKNYPAITASAAGSGSLIIDGKLNAVSINSTRTTKLNDKITTSGEQTYVAVLLDGNTELDATGSTINLNSTVSGEHSLTTSGTTKIKGNITTKGGQTYNNTVNLLAGVTLTDDAGELIQFGSTLSGNFALTISVANCEFDATVEIGSLSAVNANINCDSVTTTAIQTYSGNVTLTQSPTLTGTALTFGGDVKSSATGTGRTITFDKCTSVNNSSANVSADISYEFKNSSASTVTTAFTQGSSIYHDITSQNITLNFGNNAFTQASGSTFTVNSGTVNMGNAGVTLGNLTVDGGTFHQAGEADDSVNNITFNSGTIIWDSGDAGGTLAINGTISGAAAATINYHQKEVTINETQSVSGVFWSLVIPAGVSITNSDSIRIRKNLTIESTGSYVHNDKTLIFGTDAEDGEISDKNSSSVNLGSVVLNKTSADSKLQAKTNLLFTDLTVTKGTFDIPSEKTVQTTNLTIETNGKLANAETLNVTGNMTDSGTYSGDGTIYFTGTGNQNFTPKAGTAALHTTYKNIVNTSANPLNIKADIWAENFVIDSGETTTFEQKSEIGNLTIISAQETHFAKYASIESLTDSPTAGDIVFTEGAVINDDITLNTSGTVTFNQTVDIGEDGNKTFEHTTGDTVINGTLNASSAKFEDLQLNGTVDAITELYGNLTTTASPAGSATFTQNVSVLGNTDADLDAPVTVQGDFIIQKDSGKAVNIKQNLSITQNFALYSGDVKLKANIFTGKDVIMLGSDYSTNDTSTGYTNAYAYKTPRPNDNWSQPRFDDFSDSVKAGSLEADAGTIIHVGKNFYANGITLNNSTTNSGTWYIDIPVTSDSESAFAEAYKCTVTRCTVRKHDGTTAAGTVDSDNAQIVAENGCSLTDCANWDSDEFEIVNVWTNRDNVVYVEFNRPVRNLHGEFNDAIANFTYFVSADNDTSYSSAATQPDGSEALTSDVNGEKTIIYLVAPVTWNTDATGSNAGVAKSTDRNGNHKTSVPYIDIPRSLGTSTTASQSYVITDRFGKRLKHYSGSSRITTVLDKTGPVLVEVRTGQETHETNLANQAAYDAHNFIEFIYSEPVFFGNHSDTINTVGTQNIQVSNALGIVTSTLTSDTDLTFAGIGVTIENGQMQTRKAGVDSDDATMNAMYRDSTHSLKISLAGYAQNVSSNGTITGSYIMWPGYIEQAVLPQGAVSTTATPASPNTVVTDTDNNQQIMQKTDLTVNNSQQTGTNYGPWDTQEPVFVKVHKHGEDTALDYYEALGNGDGSTLNRIEIHVSDNPSSDESFNKYWLTGYGWTTDPSGTLLSSAADNLVGGSRPFDSLAVSNTTTGGLRYCTILNQESAFKYEVGETDSPTQNFTLIEESASAPFFAGASDTRNNIPLAKDNTYISLSLSDTSLPYKTTFTVSYDSTSSYITDLAGNRLKSVSTMKTLDRTSPDFKISFSPVNQNKIFLLFVKQLRNDIVYNGEDIDESFEEIIPYCFELGTISGSTWTTNSGSALQIDTSVPASIISSKSNSYYTAVELTLNQNATMEDIEETYIRLKPAGTVGTNTYGAQSKDPITGLDNSYVTFIQDVVGNYMPMYQAHALSDFAANMVNPLYAYNDDIEYREENLTYSLYEPESWAVHDWNKEQQNYGTLLAQKPVTVIADVDTSYFADASGDLQYTLRMFYSKNPTAGSESDEYNADIHDSLRLWAPDNSNFANNGLFPAYAAVTNQNYAYVDAVPLDTDLSKGVEFNFTETIAQNFTHGSQISFLFGVFDSSGTTQKSICLNPVLTMSGGSASYNVSAQTPLYIIRLKNPGDITSLDLWSFRVKSVAAQRGNVSIMNNVINADNGEKVVIKVDLKQKGNLNVLVMTLDGNIVDYLQRGETEEGEHFYSWDGTNRRGKTVARGMYFVRVTGPGIDETRKVLVVK